MQNKKLVRSKTILCANPFELPINGKYESIGAGMIWHGKFADDQEEDGGDHFDRLCWLCRDIKAHENDGCEPDYIEEDQSAEDEAIAYDRFNEVSEIVM